MRINGTEGLVNWFFVELPEPDEGDNDDASSNSAEGQDDSKLKKMHSEDPPEG